MKKMILVLTLALLAAGAFGVGAAFAQDEQPPLPAGGSGYLHPYMTQAMADSLGLTVDEFDARRATGETVYSIALAQGLPADEIPALMQEARASALDAAVADGLLTQEQADWMKTRGSGRGGMMGGYGPGNGAGGCSMWDGGQAPTGQFGPGMMGRW